jgi:streptogramin lyase
MVFLVVTLVSAAGIDTVAGTGDPSNNGNDGPALAINIGDPFGVEIGPDGALYVAEVRNHRVLRVDLSSRHVRSVAGTGQKGYSGDDGLARAARLNEPYEVRFSSNGSMYFVEMQNHIIRRVDAKSGRMETIAGTGQPGFGGDGGPAVDAMFNQPHSIALDRDGNIYVADIGNHRIRRIDRQTGIVETMAGTGEKKLPIEGQPARGNPVLGPRALFFDGTTLWVALREGNSIWRIDLDHGVWHHVAGTGEAGFTGDGGPASEATFNGPKGIAIGPNGDVYIADTENQAIRKVDRQSGTVTTIAGRGPQGDGSLGDGGPATEARLARPHGICVGPDGTVYLGDTLNHRVRRIQ